MIVRIVIFIVVVAALAAVAVFIADQPGRVEIEWGDYLVELTPAALAGAVALIAFAVAILALLLRWLWRGPRAYRRARLLQRERLGYQALTQGLVAAATGDATGARRLARRANHMLGEPPLTLLLSAQAAQLEGREEIAQHYFSAMLERRETEFMGLRGLIVQATKAGDVPRARELAERAFKLRPDTPWLLNALLELRLRAGERDGSNALIERARRVGAITPESAARRSAGLLYDEARAAFGAGDHRLALKLAERSAATDPLFVAAPILAAEAALKLGKRGRATRLVEAAYVRRPHPALGKLYLAAAPNVSVLDRVARLERLVALAPGHPEGRRLMAEVALEAKLWGRARAELDALIKGHPSVSAFRLHARLDDEEHKDALAARRHLEAAASAPADPAWACASCRARLEHWALVCPSCGAVETIDWREAPGPAKFDPASERAAPAVLPPAPSPAPEPASAQAASPASGAPSSAPSTAAPRLTEPPRPDA